MAPDFRRHETGRPAAGELLIQLLLLRLWTDVANRHLQKLLSCIAVTADCGFVNSKEIQSFPIKHPHGIRIAVKQKPVLLFGSTQQCRCRLEFFVDRSELLHLFNQLLRKYTDLIFRKQTWIEWPRGSSLTQRI